MLFKLSSSLYSVMQILFECILILLLDGMRFEYLSQTVGRGLAVHRVYGAVTYVLCRAMVYE